LLAWPFLWRHAFQFFEVLPAARELKLRRSDGCQW